MSGWASGRVACTLAISRSRRPCTLIAHPPPPGTRRTPARTRPTRPGTAGPAVARAAGPGSGFASHSPTVVGPEVGVHLLLQGGEAGRQLDHLPHLKAQLEYGPGGPESGGRRGPRLLEFEESSDGLGGGGGEGPSRAGDDVGLDGPEAADEVGVLEAAADGGDAEAGLGRGGLLGGPAGEGEQERVVGRRPAGVVATGASEGGKSRLWSVVVGFSGRGRVTPPRERRPRAGPARPSRP
ncbi:hypothetical protein PX52LOC_08037 [Limnoglobus roseus]|uniref:Uncharacterized protein n=1 Tax=Limnoglobus roseus TaxID=2598579 RepID=A0A5C1AUJ0_9BACT|nr:hypothetical protein PX52LOC_08037 [Limnoglobus roseus]